MSYALGNKVGLNSKYIKTKQNRKLEAKFFGLFRVLHFVGKQAYKIEFLRKGKIYDVFQVSLLEQDNTKKGRVDKNVKQIDFNASDNKGGEYEVKATWNSAIYAKELKARHLPGLYYLVFGKDYLEEENTGKLYSAMQYFRNLISSFYKKHTDKLIAIFEAIDTTLSMAGPTISANTKLTK